MQSDWAREQDHLDLAAIEREVYPSLVELEIEAGIRKLPSSVGRLLQKTARKHEDDPQRYSVSNKKMKVVRKLA